MKAFLKGNARVFFAGLLSSHFTVDRGVPQGETLSPFLFIIAMDCLMEAVLNDSRIQGVTLTPKHPKHFERVVEGKFRSYQDSNLVSQGYADDLYFCTSDPKEVEYFLEHISDFEKASNALLCKDKCELLSITKKEPPKEIAGIQQIKKEVRCLGVYFNHDGVINKLDQQITLARQVFSRLKKKLPLFKARLVS